MKTNGGQDEKTEPIVTLEEEIPDSQSRILIKVCNESFIKLCGRWNLISTLRIIPEQFI